MVRVIRKYLLEMNIAKLTVFKSTSMIYSSWFMSRTIWGSKLYQFILRSQSDIVYPAILHKRLETSNVGREKFKVMYLFEKNFCLCFISFLTSNKRSSVRESFSSLDNARAEKASFLDQEFALAPPLKCHNF